MLRLRSGSALLDLLPELGGSIGRLAVGGVDILRPAPAGTTDVLETACFPLLPFANRIAQGRFAFDGETVRLKPNFGDHPHVLHGQGWQNPWRVETSQADGALLSYDHAAGDWPWAYRAEQAIRLTPDALDIALRLENRSGRAMPASVGFHPYFRRTARTVLRTEAGGVWLSDATMIPTGTAPPGHFLDLAAGARIDAAPFIDNCYFDWPGRAVVEFRDVPATVLLTASAELGFLHLFVPRDTDYFCVEPVSAMPDAFNRGASMSGTRVIAPDESLAVSVALRWDRIR